MAEPVIDRLNTALEGRYRIERELGEGGMAGGGFSPLRARGGDELFYVSPQQTALVVARLISGRPGDVETGGRSSCGPRRARESGRRNARRLGPAQEPTRTEAR